MAKNSSSGVGVFDKIKEQDKEPQRANRGITGGDHSSVKETFGQTSNPSSNSNLGGSGFSAAQIRPSAASNIGSDSMAATYLPLAVNTPAMQALTTTGSSGYQMGTGGGMSVQILDHQQHNLESMRYQSAQNPQSYCLQNRQFVPNMAYGYQQSQMASYDFSKKTGRYSSPPIVNSFGGRLRSSGGASPFGPTIGLGLGGFGRSHYGPVPQDVYWHYNPGPEIYSRKVFVGGLPIDIDEDEINTTFSRFGPLVVDWPHKSQSKAYFPPKGYVFLIFEHEPSVQSLVEHCHQEDDKHYICVSSPTMREKPVQVRPWRLADADFVVDASLSLDPRKSVFIGGVPRPLKAVELAHIMDRLYGGVCYAGIDTDPELKYPKGAGRVAFSNQQSYIAAISARFVQLQHGDVDKRVEVKPYVLDDQMCDECQGSLCGGKYAPFFCANVTCLQYYCEQCWAQIHSRSGREYHKPLVKENTDRSPRGIMAAASRWSGGPCGVGH